MGWHIDLLENTVEITDKIAQKIFAAVSDEDGENEYFYDLDDVILEGKLNFNPDHMEHMDYLHDERIVNVLKSFKVKGDITFTDQEGDSKGCFWGYRFDGKGGFKPLKGKAAFVEEKPKKKAKTSTKKLSLQEVADIVESEGLGYAIQHHTSANRIKDKELAALWQRCAELLEAIEARLPLQEF